MRSLGRQGEGVLRTGECFKLDSRKIMSFRFIVEENGKLGRDMGLRVSSSDDFVFV